MHRARTLRLAVRGKRSLDAYRPSPPFHVRSSKSFYIFVYDTKADAVLPSSTLVTALEEDGAKLALKAAGFAIVSFVTTQSAGEGL